MYLFMYLFSCICASIHYRYISGQVATLVQMVNISVSGEVHSAESAVHDKALRGFTKGQGAKTGQGG